MKRFIILAGYCELGMYLYWTGKLDQYINTRYTYLAFLSMGIAFILAAVQLIIWVKQLDTHQHKQLGWGSLLTLAIPLVVGFFLPTVTLDATTVASKGYQFPLAATVDVNQSLQSADGTDIQYLKPDTSLFFTKKNYELQMAKSLSRYQQASQIAINNENYMEVMELIYLFPDQFMGKTISYSGFVYKDPEYKGQQYLFRFGIIHCIADSGVYGLLTKGNEMSYDDNTWIQVSGQLTKAYNQSLDLYLPALDITESSAISQPENPYVYRQFY